LKIQEETKEEVKDDEVNMQEDENESSANLSSQMGNYFQLKT
jgi:hypothetical protein